MIKIYTAVITSQYVDKNGCTITKGECKTVRKQVYIDLDTVELIDTFYMDVEDLDAICKDLFKPLTHWGPVIEMKEDQE